MRIALISDLHANIIALDTVLASIEAAGVDRLVCLGDVATLGPRPTETIARLRALDASFIQGNHDAFLTDAEFAKSYTEAPVILDAIDWCRAELSPDDLEFVTSFVSDLKIDCGRGHTLHLFHGSPRSCVEDILTTTSEEALSEMLQGARATVLAGGHTHLPMVRTFEGMTILNPGSVGCPFESYVGGGQTGRPPTLLPEAQYAIIDASSAQVSIDCRRLPLDRRRLRDAALASACPLQEYLASQYA